MPLGPLPVDVLPDGSVGLSWLPKKHLSGTAGAADVSTRFVTRGLAAIADIIQLGAFGAFTGDPGLSKTYVAITGCEAAKVRRVFFEVPDRPVGKQLEQGLVLAMFGSVDRSATRAALQEKIRGWFEVPGLLALDEAKRLGVEGVETLRYLASGPSSRAAILFVGSDLDPLFKRNEALRDRIARPLEFKPLTQKEMLEAVRQYHPFFADATQDLATVYSEYAKGRFRRWARLLEAGQPIAAALGVPALTPKVYRLARAKIVSAP
jgi:hypothetical protein